MQGSREEGEEGGKAVVQKGTLCRGTRDEAKPAQRSDKGRNSQAPAGDVQSSRAVFFSLSAATQRHVYITHTPQPPAPLLHHAPTSTLPLPPPSLSSPTMQAHDRLLIVGEALSAGPAPSSFTGSSGSTGGSGPAPAPTSADVVPPNLASAAPANDLSISHVQLPLSYMGPNWPLLHCAVSPSGMDIVVAGRRGLALYNRPAHRWGFFEGGGRGRERVGPMGAGSCCLWCSNACAF